MAGWRGRWHTFSSFLICALVVVLGTLLYPIFLLFFSGIALVFPLYRRFGSAALFPRKDAPRGKTGR